MTQTTPADPLAFVGLLTSEQRITLKANTDQGNRVLRGRVEGEGAGSVAIVTFEHVNHGGEVTLGITAFGTPFEIEVGA